MPVYQFVFVGVQYRGLNHVLHMVVGKNSTLSYPSLLGFFFFYLLCILNRVDLTLTNISLRDSRH